MEYFTEVRTDDHHECRHWIRETFDYIGQFPKVVLIGLGKSYLAVNLAAKVANSYGLKWYSIDAGSALHGDIGIVNPSDLIIFVSKSGKTKELLEIAKLLPNPKLALTLGEDRNLLSQFCQFSLNIPLLSEYSVHDKAPMNSTLQTLMILYNAINYIVENTHIESYSNNHSAGEIGKSLQEVRV